ncbi:hypothetical protein BKA64DRAFT_765876 [Cadophora sp. MPI-SDFR-AT-0126]|nr:hypothetical protein BKA64DRAFT_765876 [Leotiomycetes sp. MPI-SDFR-AT-0126]
MSSQCQNTMEGGDDIQGTQVLHSRSRESTPSDVATSLAPEPASIRAPYQGEDSRVTLLRNFDDKLQEWVAPFFAGKFVEQEGQPDNHITISIEMARFYQLITRGSIPRIAFLESEYDQLKVKHSALEKKELELERTVACQDKSNSNLREQLDAVERGCMAQGEVTIEMYAELPDKIGFPSRYRALGLHFFHNIKLRLNLRIRSDHDKSMFLYVVDGSKKACGWKIAEGTWLVSCIILIRWMCKDRTTESIAARSLGIIAIEMMQNSIPSKEDGKFTLKHPN